MTCHNCGGQGWTKTAEIFDCSAPGCDVAERRTALEQAIKQTERQIGPMTQAERDWFCATWRPNTIMLPRPQVGCMRPDGLLNIHSENHYCEVCAPPPRKEKAC